jgi:FMN reductase
VRQVVRGRLTGVHAHPVPTTVVAAPADRQPSASGDEDGLHARIDRAACEPAAAMRTYRR